VGGFPRAYRQKPFIEVNYQVFGAWAWCAWRVWAWQSGDCVCLWIASLVGLRGAAGQRLWMSMDCQLGRPEGCRPAEWRSFRPLQAWGHSRVENMRVWITSLAALGGRAWWSRDHADLCRPEGQGPAEIVNVCSSPAWQTLEAWSGGDHAGLRGRSLGECGPGGVEEQAQVLEILQPSEQQLYRPMWQGLACSACYSFSIS
jgi:hypothetical protein